MSHSSLLWFFCQNTQELINIKPRQAQCFVAWLKAEPSVRWDERSRWVRALTTEPRQKGQATPSGAIRLAHLTESVFEKGKMIQQIHGKREGSKMGWEALSTKHQRKGKLLPCIWPWVLAAPLLKRCPTQWVWVHLWNFPPATPTKTSRRSVSWEILIIPKKTNGVCVFKALLIP